MANSAECERCGAEERTKHLLWNFPFSQVAWIHLNDILELKKNGFVQNSFLQEIF
jgi:hypothetical protein